MPNSMLIFTVSTQENYLCMPWKNGLGETLEILKMEDQHGLRFRISQAAVVDDGHFSNFSGLQRTLILLRGKGMVLTHQASSGSEASHEHCLSSPLDQAVFDGGALTNASLQDGAIDDLNVMVRANDTQAVVTSMMASGACPTVPEDALLYGFYALHPTVLRIESYASNTHVNVPSDGFIHLHQSAAVQLESGQGVCILITPK